MTFQIVPIFGSCEGTPITVVVTVNPIPVVTATPSSQTICSGGTTDIALSSNVTSGTTTFSWTVKQSGVTGASDNSGSSIAQTLTATGNTSGTATYAITPSFGGCNGTPITVVVTVNPIPVATATPVCQRICSGGTTHIILSSNVENTTFNWDVVQNGVRGAKAGSGSLIKQRLRTTCNRCGTVTYIVTPTANGCVGAPILVEVTVCPCCFSCCQF